MNQSDVIQEAADISPSYVTHFIPMNAFVAISYVFCNVIGLPLNFVIAAFIVFLPRLHQTRNILWLGVAFSNVLVLLEHLVGFYAYQFQSEAANKIFALVTGLPCASLMLNLFFSLVDRYVSVAHSAWYKRNVTITWVVSSQIGCFSILSVLTKGPYLLDIIPLPIGLTSIDMKIFSILGFTIFLLCAVGQVIVYFKIKYYLNLEKDSATSLSSHRRAQHNYNAKQRQANNTQTAKFMGGESQEENSLYGFLHNAAAVSLQNTTAIAPSPLFIQIGNQKISRLELDAARHAVDAVSLFLVFFLPSLVTLSFATFADCSSSNHLIRQECSVYLWSLSYTRALVVFYTIVNPIFFVKRSRDLIQALNRRR